MTKKKKATTEKKAKAGKNDSADSNDSNESSAHSAGPAVNSVGTVSAPTVSGANTSGSMKNFRHHPDMENFYRFVYENDLRYEALDILTNIINEKRARKQAKLKKAKVH